MSSRYVVSLICAPQLEEALLDTLLVYFGNEVFTSMPIASHGTHPQLLSPAERVLGRQRSVYIRALLSHEETEELVRLLKKDFQGTGIRYWASPIALEGEIV